MPVNADNTETRAPARLVMAVDEGVYSALWYEPPDQRQPLTPRIFPPPARGKKPKVIPFRKVIHAERLMVAPLGDDFPWPKVATCQERFLRPANSPTLGPNACLSCGPITMVDRWRRDKDWHLTFYVDCGVPVQFEEDYHWPTDWNEIKEGIWLMGIVKLSAWGTGWAGGLFQPVTGCVKGMQVLELDPASPAFGKLRRVPFGHRLTVDPDFVQHESVWVVLDVTEICPPMYRPFPARPAECREPRFPGLVRIEDGGGPRIVQVTPPGVQEPPPDAGEPGA